MRRPLAASLAAALLAAALACPAAAETAPYREPQGAFAFTPPPGWLTDDSGHMGPGLVAKGPAVEGSEPLINLTHEKAGIVTLEVRWQTLLGQMRFDYERLRYLSLEEHEEATPPWSQALYSYQRGEQAFVSLTRLVLADGRFYLMTAVAPDAAFAALHPAFLASFDSLQPGK